jgi:hypothetical protein
MVRQLINDELESICKDVVVAKSRFYPGIFLEELRNALFILASSWSRFELSTSRAQV